MSDNQLHDWIDAGWNDMSDRLDRELPRRRRGGAAWWWLGAGAMVLLLLGGTALGHISRSPDQRQPAGVRQSPPQIAATDDRPLACLEVPPTADRTPAINADPQLNPVSSRRPVPATPERSARRSANPVTPLAALPFSAVSPAAAIIDFPPLITELRANPVTLPLTTALPLPIAPKNERPDLPELTRTKRGLHLLARTEINSNSFGNTGWAAGLQLRQKDRPGKKFRFHANLRYRHEQLDWSRILPQLIDGTAAFADLEANALGNNSFLLTDRSAVFSGLVVADETHYRTQKVEFTLGLDRRIGRRLSIGIEGGVDYLLRSRFADAPMRGQYSFTNTALTITSFTVYNTLEIIGITNGTGRSNDDILPEAFAESQHLQSSITRWQPVARGQLTYRIGQRLEVESSLRYRFNRNGDLPGVFPADWRVGLGLGWRF
ncbi:MAG: hypothetical protein WBA17_17575 [Saprospiraceae bacterium]